MNKCYQELQQKVAIDRGKIQESEYRIDAKEPKQFFIQKLQQKKYLLKYYNPKTNYLDTTFVSKAKYFNGHV